jgi:hypothetical protein
MCPQLVIGTSDGKVIIYNRTDSILQLHERKGTLKEAVTCGDWMSDNRIGLASGMRVKISQPIPETNAKWETYSKFKIGGMGSKVPKHMRASGAPTALGFTQGSYPPFVAVTLGSKYLLTFDTNRTHEDLGLTFPEDYGGIVGFHWLPSNMLLVSLSNGYIVTVDFAALIKLQAGGNLPTRITAMATSRVRALGAPRPPPALSGRAVPRSALPRARTPGKHTHTHAQRTHTCSCPRSPARTRRSSPSTSRASTRPQTSRWRAAATRWSR